MLSTSGVISKSLKIFIPFSLKNNIQFFATSSDDCTCKLWRIDDPELIRTYTAHALRVTVSKIIIFINSCKSMCN